MVERLGDYEACDGNGRQPVAESGRADGIAWPKKFLDAGGEARAAEGSRHRQRTVDVTCRDMLDGKNGIGNEKRIVKSPGRFRIGCLLAGKAQVVQKTPSDRGPVEKPDHGRDGLPKDVPATLVRRLVFQDCSQQPSWKAPAEGVRDNDTGLEHSNRQRKRRRRADPRDAANPVQVGTREKRLQSPMASSQ